MGSKISKTREANDGSLPSKPYRFLDTSKIPSSYVPNMIKSFLRPAVDGKLSSLAFLRDEKWLPLGAMYFGNYHDMSLMSIIMRSWSPSGHFDDNIICLIDLDSGEMQKVLIDGCPNSVYDIFVSSNNKIIAIIICIEPCLSHLQLWQCNGTLHLFHQLCRKSNLHSIVDEITQQGIIYVTCSSISPNGKWLVLAGFLNVFRTENNSYLEIYIINKNKLDKEQSSLIGNTKYPELLMVINLEFSSDSDFLAVGSFADVKSRVFLLSTKTWQVILHVGENMEPFSFIWGVFNPLSTHHELISLTKQGCLEKWDASPLHNELNQQLDSVDKMCITDGLPELTYITWCPKFSRDGKMFAIPLSDGSVIILDPNLFETLWTIPCPVLSELDLSNLPQTMEATSVCFSNSCEYLTVGYSGDIVCAWLLPRMHFTLKHFCRTKIISMCPPCLVHKLPIPTALKQYLLYQL